MMTEARKIMHQNNFNQDNHPRSTGDNGSNSPDTCNMSLKYEVNNKAC